MKDPIEFSDKEQFILSYYRDPQLSSWGRHVVLEGIYLGASILCAILYFAQQDLVWGLVGYGILVWRLTWGVWYSRESTKSLRSIILKYEARVRDLEEQPPRGE